MISQIAKEFLYSNQDLLQVNPTKFLIEAESSMLDVKDIIDFIEIFDSSNISFDINQLFNSEIYNFKNKYVKKGSTQQQIENSFLDNHITLLISI